MNDPRHLRDLSKRPPAGKPGNRAALKWPPAGGPQPPVQHLENVLREAESLFDTGEYGKGVESLCHAVLVAATTGTQGMETHELIHRLRKIAGWEYTPGEAA